MKSLAALVLPFILWIGSQYWAYGQVPDTIAVPLQDTIRSKPGDSSVKLQKSTFNTEVKYSARDSVVVDLRNKIVHLYGNAEVYYEKIALKAAYISLNFNTSVLSATYGLDSAGEKTGIPHFEEDGRPYDADTMRYNFKTKRAVVSYVKLKEGEGYIYGRKVTKDPEDNTYIRDARYTTCDAPHPHFYIYASRIKVIPGKQIVTGPANLRIADVSTPAWVPFGFFPIRQGRKSGIIIPTYGFSDIQGYFLRNGGYYFGISDYVDLAVTGDIYSYGSWGLRTNSTYAKRYAFGGNAGLVYINNRYGDPEDVENFRQEKNFSINWNHVQDPKLRPNTTFRASVNYSSVNYLQINSYNVANIPTSQQNSSIAWSKLLGGGKANFSVNAEHRQNNQTRAIDFTLPQMNFDVPRFFPFKGKISSGVPKWYQSIAVTYNLNVRNRISTYDSLLFKDDLAKQLNNGASHSATLSTQMRVLKWLSFNPVISANDYQYVRTIEKRWDTGLKAIDTDTVYGFANAYDYTFSVPFTTALYGMYSFGNKGLSAIRHAMYPSVSFSYRPDFSNSKYGFYRTVQADSANTQQQTYSIFEGGVVGGPQGGKSGLVIFNMNNVLEAKTRKQNDTGFVEKKVKIFDQLSLNTSYNMLADSVRWAPLRAEARTVLFQRITFWVGGSFNFYGLDPAGNQIKLSSQETEGKWARPTDAFVKISMNLNNDIFKGNGQAAAPPPGGTNYLQQAALAANPNVTAYDLALLQNAGNFVDFNIPWNLTLNYNIIYAKPARTETISQTVLFNGDLKLSENWKIGFNSGYDFTKKEINLTSIDFYRQLHCWEFRLNWIPIGFRQSFLFTLNVKSSVLQDLKINRRRDWYDNQ